MHVICVIWDVILWVCPLIALRASPILFWGCKCEVRGGEIHPFLKLLFQTNATSEAGKLAGHDYRPRETTKRFEGHLSWLVNLPPPEIMV